MKKYPLFIAINGGTIWERVIHDPAEQVELAAWLTAHGWSVKIVQISYVPKRSNLEDQPNG